MLRVQVPVAPDVKADVEERPEDLGLDPNVSKAQLHGAVYKAGYETLRQEHRSALRMKSYERWAKDPEELAAASAVSDEAFEAGLI